MGKGDGRRRENAAAIDTNWARALSKLGDFESTTEELNNSAGEIIISDYDAYRELQRDAKIARHVLKVLPTIYWQMVRELESDWPAT